MNSRNRLGGAVGAGATLIGLVVGLLLIWWGNSLSLMIFAGVLFAILLQSFAGWAASRTHLPYGWCLGAELLILSLLIVVFGYTAYPALAAQASELVGQLPQAVERVQTAIEQSRLANVLSSGTGSPPQIGRSLMSRLAALAANALDGIIAAVVIVFVGIYLAAEPTRYRDGVLRLIPTAKHNRAQDILSALGGVLRRWLIARSALMLVNGAMTTVGLWLIGVPLAPVLGLIAGLMNFVPNVGPVIAAVPAVLIALGQSPMTAVYTAALYFGLQMLDGYILTPLVQRRAIALGPALIISFQVLMGFLAGTLGLLLATPLAAALAVIIRMIYIEDTLGDRGDSSRHAPADDGKTAGSY